MIQIEYKDMGKLIYTNKDEKAGYRVALKKVVMGAKGFEVKFKYLDDIRNKKGQKVVGNSYIYKRYVSPLQAIDIERKLKSYKVVSHNIVEKLINDVVGKA